MSEYKYKYIGSIILIISIVGVVICGINLYNNYFSYNYTVEKATKYLYTAENLMNKTQISDRLDKALNELSDLEGNYAWWFPTDETNISTIKSAINSLSSLLRNDVNQTILLGSFEYTNTVKLIENIIYDLELAQKIVLESSVHSGILLVVSIIGILVAIILLFNN